MIQSAPNKSRKYTLKVETHNLSQFDIPMMKKVMLNSMHMRGRPTMPVSLIAMIAPCLLFLFTLLSTVHAAGTVSP